MLRSLLPSRGLLAARGLPLTSNLAYGSVRYNGTKSFTKLTLPADDFAKTKLVHGSTDLTIAITPGARDKLYRIANEDKNTDTALKIDVESGGCHGFQYNLDLANLSEVLKDDADMLVFKRTDGDKGEYGVAQLVLNEASLEILQELKIDYTKELIGSQFKVVDSPYTSTECGCGASFDFDFDKLEKVREERGRA